MSTIPLYNALVKAGVPEADAQAAVDSIALTSETASKVDIAMVRSDMAEMKSSLVQWMAGLIFAAVAITVTLIKLLP